MLWLAGSLTLHVRFAYGSLREELLRDHRFNMRRTSAAAAPLVMGSIHANSDNLKLTSDRTLTFTADGSSVSEPAPIASLHNESAYTFFRLGSPKEAVYSPSSTLNHIPANTTKTPLAFNMGGEDLGPPEEKTIDKEATKSAQLQQKDSRQTVPNAVSISSTRKGASVSGKTSFASANLQEGWPTHSRHTGSTRAERETEGDEADDESSASSLTSSVHTEVSQHRWQFVCAIPASSASFSVISCCPESPVHRTVSTDVEDPVLKPFSDGKSNNRSVVFGDSDCFGDPSNASSLSLSPLPREPQAEVLPRLCRFGENQMDDSSGKQPTRNNGGTLTDSTRFTTSARQLAFPQMVCPSLTAVSWWIYLLGIFVSSVCLFFAWDIDPQFAGTVSVVHLMTLLPALSRKYIILVFAKLWITFLLASAVLIVTILNTMLFAVLHRAHLPYYVHIAWTQLASVVIVHVSMIITVMAHDI
eukprot:Gregarina_sp_Poly_1__984@NODE_123_length_13493_cov_176_815135_g110_i0_p4_GENE_NODE_123_length_13493_cov_176_815135_g110_i0NODE_123_length_13493_cov_176_815135_g110_i0_p4_ORF_typecomplete_len473_score52_49_NODE_123_length_13493_cov_176_815135_g110_i01207513493